VFGKRPAVHAAFEALVATRPVLCRMSGSGSALLAVYRSDRDRADAREMLGRKHGILIETGTAA
jgi:4-diphosphocytidyl-2C-methyl-D-erythritol kinase